MTESTLSPSARITWIKARFAEAKLDAYGKAYYNALQRSFMDYNEAGLRTQVLYIIGNARFPKGSQARAELLQFANG